MGQENKPTKLPRPKFEPGDNVVTISHIVCKISYCKWSAEKQIWMYRLEELFECTDDYIISFEEYFDN